MSRSSLASLAPVAIASLLALMTAACGGKILMEEGSSSGSSGSNGSSGSSASSSGQVSPPPSFSPSPSSSADPPSPPDASVSPNGMSVEEACETVCHRNAQCGATASDCADSCVANLAPGALCSASYRAYVFCFAEHIEGCAALPPVCEDAYCAYARCMGKPLASYCH